MNSMSTILVVDRNPRNIELLGKFLGKEGFETLSASTREEFEQVVNLSKPIHLALVDIAGFDRGIWDQCESLRDKGIPFLVISSKQTSRIEQESLTHGAKGMLTKPLAARELLGLIRSLIPK